MQPGFLTRQQVWPGLAKMLNEIQDLGLKDDHEDFPLPEEFDLQAFLPLADQFKGYNFRQVLKGCTLDPKTVKSMRVARIVKLGLIMSYDNWNGRKVLCYDGKAFTAVE